jgi:hypothetical protein
MGGTGRVEVTGRGTGVFKLLHLDISVALQTSYPTPAMPVYLIIQLLRIWRHRLSLNANSWDDKQASCYDRRIQTWSETSIQNPLISYIYQIGALLLRHGNTRFGIYDSNVI